MTKRDLVLRIASETQLPYGDVLQVIQKFLDHISEGLVAGEHFEFRDFGVFELVTRKSRVGRNPNKPEDTVVIPERKVVKFKAGKLLREKLLKRQAPQQ